MALLSGFQVSLADVNLLGAASVAAFAGKPVPAGWTVITPAQLGLAAQYQDGNYFKNGISGASAIVLQKGNDYIVAFRGTDDNADVANYARLGDGSYIDYFRPLLDAVAASAPAGANFAFTGASLGGGAANIMADIAASAFSGRFADARFVAFASPNISDAGGIVNFGFENDPIYKVVHAYADRASSLDHLVLATDEYIAGNYNGRDPWSDDAHSRAELGFEAVARLSASEFYDAMQPDSVVIFAASEGVIQDQHPGRGNTGAFYLGEADSDRIAGRAGNDFIEGFAGDDTLTGGAGNDRIKGGLGNDVITGGLGNDLLEGGDGNDRFIVTGTEARLDKILGGAGRDIVKVAGTADLTLSGFGEKWSIEIWQGNGKAVLGDAGANTFDFSRFLLVGGVSHFDAGAGNDVLTGSRQADALRGGSGLDRITGGLGDDTLTGGADSDVFVFNAGFGRDTITDFAEGAGQGDVIQLDDALFADFAAVTAAAVQVGAHVEIRYDADNVLTLHDVSLTGTNRLAADDFLFV